MDHISTDDLERYHLGRVSDALSVTGIEQHISECRDCADRMLAIERFIYSVRAGVIQVGSKSYDHFFIPAQDLKR
jgi:hypothetical protein